MTTPPDDEPVIPDAMRGPWRELLATIAEREQVQAKERQLAQKCRDLIVILLRGGVRREFVVGRPFSSAWVTRIQREEGLVRRRIRRADKAK